jgi:hypothetical protein
MDVRGIETDGHGFHEHMQYKFSKYFLHAF